jgi:3-deoxy-7-phosphoheptulonate synthase
MSTQLVRLVAKKGFRHRTLVQIGDVRIGDEELVLMAGPCAVEGEEQVFTIAEQVAHWGAKVLRGGAFKPRTSPYSFQGLGEEGLKLLRKAADTFGLLVVTEVLEPAQVELVAHYADILQIGARNMQNYPLLKAVGRCGKPVLLKRGLAAMIEEWLWAAEYILAEGNPSVILCERGIRTFETMHARFSLDLTSIPTLKALTHLPVIVDPSHAAGDRMKVIPLALAGIAAGADGLIVEVHHRPERALSDGAQALTPQDLGKLVQALVRVGEAVGRPFGPGKGAACEAQGVAA